MRGSFCNLLRLLLQLLISGRVSGCSCYSGRRARPGVCCRLLSAHSELGRYRPGRSGVQPLGHNSRGGATRQRTHRQRSFRFRQPVPTLNGTVGRLRTHRHSLDAEHCRKNATCILPGRVIRAAAVQGAFLLHCRQRIRLLLADAVAVQAAAAALVQHLAVRGRTIAPAEAVLKMPQRTLCTIPAEGNICLTHPQLERKHIAHC